MTRCWFRNSLKVRVTVSLEVPISSPISLCVRAIRAPDFMLSAPADQSSKNLASLSRGGGGKPHRVQVFAGSLVDRSQLLGDALISLGMLREKAREITSPQKSDLEWMKSRGRESMGTG